MRKFLMNVHFLTDEDAAGVILKLIKESSHIDIAVAWAGENEIVEALLKNSSKLRNVINGTHMYQTKPSVLQKFMANTAVRYMPPSGKLFHPKVYIFTNEANEQAAIIGSHNLTHSAFSGHNNIEASVLITGTSKDLALSQMLSFIQTNWKNACTINNEFLFSYKRQYRNNLAKSDDLHSYAHLSSPKSPQSISPIELSWKGLVDKIQNGKYSNLYERLEILEKALSLFQSYTSLADMPKDARKAIAGTYRTREKQLDDLQWPLFGRMISQGSFTKLIYENSKQLSAALDHIPLEGRVSQKEFNDFSDQFRSAFNNSARKGGVATASRLLCMKRPDVFICLNSKNRVNLCKALNIRTTGPTLQEYWSKVIIPIQNSQWWQNDRPRNSLEGRIWDYRAALLDCIYYTP